MHRAAPLSLLSVRSRVYDQESRDNITHAWNNRNQGATNQAGLSRGARQCRTGEKCDPPEFLLWGGMYFPILPLYKRMPATWRDKPLKAPPARNVILGFLEAFDPDVLVQLSRAVPDFIIKTGLEIIKPDDIWKRCA